MAGGAVVPTLLTLDSTPSSSASGDSLYPVCSGNGTLVVFISTADNLVENDANGGLSDVFAADLVSDTIRLVSVSTAGVAGNGPSRSPTVSRDGRWIAFVSAASDLVSGDTNGVADIFVRDLVAGVTRCVSCTPEGVFGNDISEAPMISAEGRFVAFETRATNLDTNDLSAAWDVYLKDLTLGTQRRISAPSRSPALRARPSAEATGAVLSDDGEAIAFSSAALNLAPGLLAGTAVVTNDLYVLRAPAATNRMVDLLSEANLVSADRVASRHPALSADGRYLAALRIGSNTNRIPSGFYRVDLESGDLVRVDDGLRGQTAADPSDLVGPLLSADGGTVIFETRVQPDPTPSGVLHLPVVYAWEAISKTARRVSSGGRRQPEASDPSDLPWGQLLGASRDGEYVAFRGGNTNEPYGAATNQIQIRQRSTGELRRVSRRANGDALGSTSFPSVSFSDDGRHMSFQSDDPQVVTGDRNRAWDVFVYDWDSDTIRLISRALPSKPSRTGMGRATLGRQGQALSQDARWLVYASSVDGSVILPDANQVADVFVRDLVTGSNRLVSANADRTATGNGPSRDGAISANGRFVAFASFASDLVAGDTNRQDDVFVHDLEQATTVLVSRRSDDGPSRRASRTPVISADGRWIAFECDDSLVSIDFNGTTDIYLYDSLNQSVRLVSETGNGSTSGVSGGIGRASGRPTFSPDGQWLVYQTLARELPPASVTQETRVLARHLPTWNQEEWGSAPLSPLATALISDSFPLVTFSVDGRYAAGMELGSSLASGGRVFLREVATGKRIVVATNGWPGTVTAGGTKVVLTYRPEEETAGPTQVALWDRGTENLRPISQNGLGEPGNGDSRRPRLTSDGRFVVFTSRASNLVDGDTNQLADIFIRDLVAGTTVRFGGGSLSVEPFLGADDRTVVFTSAAREFATGDFNADMDLFVARLPGPESGFRVTEIRRSGTGFATLLWAVRDRQTYAVEATDDLDSPWRTLPVEVRVENGQATAEDTSTGLVTRRFYRIREIPAP